MPNPDNISLSDVNSTLDTIAKLLQTMRFNLDPESQKTVTDALFLLDDSAKKLKSLVSEDFDPNIFRDSNGNWICVDDATKLTDEEIQLIDMFGRF